MGQNSTAFRPACRPMCGSMARRLRRRRRGRFSGRCSRSRAACTARSRSTATAAISRSTRTATSGTTATSPGSRHSPRAAATASAPPPGRPSRASPDPRRRGQRLVGREDHGLGGLHQRQAVGAAPQRGIWAESGARLGVPPWLLELARVRTAFEGGAPWVRLPSPPRWVGSTPAQWRRWRRRWSAASSAGRLRCASTSTAVRCTATRLGMPRGWSAPDACRVHACDGRPGPGRADLVDVGLVDGPCSTTVFPACC